MSIVPTQFIPFIYIQSASKKRAKIGRNLPDLNTIQLTSVEKNWLNQDLLSPSSTSIEIILSSLEKEGQV